MTVSDLRLATGSRIHYLLRLVGLAAVCAVLTGVVVPMLFGLPLVGFAALIFGFLVGFLVGLSSGRRPPPGIIEATPAVSAPATGQAAGAVAAPASVATPTTDGEEPQRRGWRLPGQQPRLDPAQLATPDPSIAHAPTGRPALSEPVPTMRGAVFGQVTSEDQATIQGTQKSYPIVTLRLERNDPHAGRSFVASVRLDGEDAVGFADVGDWVEAVGRQTSAFLSAKRCVNHTTGAVFDGGYQLSALRIVLMIFVVLVMVGAISLIAGSRP